MTLTGRGANALLLAFEGRLLAVMPGLGEAQVARGFGVARVNGLQLTSVDLESVSIAGTASLPVTDPTAAPLTSVRIAASVPSGQLGIDPLAPPFSEPAVTHDTLALPGEIRVCMLVAPLPPCVGGFSIPLTMGNGSVGVGIGGLLTVGGSGSLRVSLHAAPFTLNTAYATGTTQNGAGFAAFSTGSIGGPSLFTSTAGQTGGFLSIVTPTRVQAAGGGATNGLITGFLRLEISFLPEPGSFLLLGSGVLALAGLERRRNRRRVASVSIGVASLLATGCFPELPLGTPGHWDYQALSRIEIPGGVFNAAALNTRFEHEGLSIDTKVGPRKVFARVYNTGSRGWHASWEMHHDGTTFVDQYGTVHDLEGVPFDAAIPGSYWVRVDGDSIKTKGGLTYHFDGQGRLESETWSAGGFPQLAYVWGASTLAVEECVSQGQQQSGQCRLLVTIPYGPDGPMEIVDEVSAAASVVRKATYRHDGAGRILEAKTPRQQAQGVAGTRYEYGPNGLLRAQLLPDGERIEYDYAQTHLFRVRPIGEENPVDRFDYADGTLGGYAVVHTSPLGGRTKYTFTFDRELTKIERLDLSPPEVMTLHWHAGLKRPSRITGFDGSERAFPTWQDDDPTTVVLPSGNTLTYSYEPDGVNHANAIARPIAQLSDDLGSIFSVSFDPDTGLPASRTDAEGAATGFAYLAGNLVRTTAPWGTTTDFLSFGAAGHWRDAEVSSVPEVTIHRKFDVVGNPVVPVAGLQRGGVLAHAYDRDRRLASMQVAATDDGGLVTSTDFVSFTLRSDGQPLAIARPLGADHEFDYDALGRTVRVCERVEGGCRETVLEYDASGRRVALVRPNGMREEYDSDPYGRPTAHRAYRDSVLYGEATFTWQQGHLVSVTDSVRNETRTLAYDPVTGRLTSESFSANGESRILGYDVRSRIIRETFIVPPAIGSSSPTVLDLGTDYDLADRPVRVFLLDASPEGELLREWVILDGRVVQVRDGNGDVRDTLFDPQTQRVVGYEMRDGAGMIVEAATLTRSVELGPSRFQVTTQTLTALAETEEEYWLNRPGSLLDPNGKVGMRVFRARGWDDGVLAHDRSYHWDALSNVIDDPGGDSYSYNADRTRLLAASGNGWSHSYEYDEAGYVTSRDGLEIDWTATGRVARVGPVLLPLAEATWDLAGGLARLTADGETREFSYFGGRVERDATTGGPGWLHLGGVSLPFVGGERRFRHGDFRGNTSVVADESGAIVSHRRHHAFGVAAVHGTSGSGGSGVLEQLVLSGFAGGVAAQALGLSFNGARVLDTDTGRFLSPDPLLHPLNQVTYAVGNPILFADRGGLQEAPSADVTSPFIAMSVAAPALIGSGIKFGLAVSALNAAAPGAAAATAGLAVVATGLATVSSALAFGFVVFKLLQAIDATLEKQADGAPGQRKELVLQGAADDPGAASRGTELPIAPLAPAPGVGVTPCSPLGAAPWADGSNAFPLRLVLLLALASVSLALSAAARARFGQPGDALTEVHMTPSSQEDR